MQYKQTCINQQQQGNVLIFKMEKYKQNLYQGILKVKYHINPLESLIKNFAFVYNLSVYAHVHPQAHTHVGSLLLPHMSQDSNSGHHVLAASTFTW